MFMVDGVSLMIMTLLAGWQAGWQTGSSGQKSWEGWEGKHWSWDGMAGRGEVAAPLPLLCQPQPPPTLLDYTVVLSRQAEVKQQLLNDKFSETFFCAL